MKSARQVLALTTRTSRGPTGALIHVNTLPSSGVTFVSFVAKTLVAASKILTSAVLTEAVAHLSTFVDVVPTVGEARTVGAQLLVLQTARTWARGTRGTPSKHVGKFYPTTTAG